MKNGLFGIFAFLMLFSINSVALPLFGTWNSKCNPEGNGYHLISVEIHEDVWTQTNWWASDARCENIILEQQTMFQVEIESEKWNGRALMAYIRPYTKDLAILYNAESLCGHNDWKHGRIIEVTGKDCDGFQIPNFDEQLFSVIKIEGPRNNMLWLGVPDIGHEGTTELTRHQRLGDDVFVLDYF